MIYDNEIHQLEDTLDMVEPKKSRPTPTSTLDEIAKEVENEMGPIVLNDRSQPVMDIKKVFCYVAMELGHHPKDVGERCGIDRTSAIHHWNSMKQTIWTCSVAKQLAK
jgi:hypothetical protein